MKLTKALLFGFGVQAQTEVFEVGVGGDGVDEEHKKNIQSIVIDQNWKDFDDRAQLLFAELFPQVVEDPDFLANVSIIRSPKKEFSQPVVIFNLSRKKKSSKKMLKCAKMAVIQMAKRFNVTKQEAAL